MPKRQKKDPLLEMFPSGYVTRKGRVFPTEEAAEPTAKKYKRPIIKPRGGTGHRVVPRKRSN